MDKSPLLLLWRLFYEKRLTAHKIPFAVVFIWITDRALGSAGPVRGGSAPHTAQLFIHRIHEQVALAGTTLSKWCESTHRTCCKETATKWCTQWHHSGKLERKREKLMTKNRISRADTTGHSFRVWLSTTLRSSCSVFDSLEGTWIWLLSFQPTLLNQPVQTYHYSHYCWDCS